MDWYRTHLRRLFFDMHLPDWTEAGQSGGEQHELRGMASRFDPQMIIAECVRARINVIVVFAKCQYGNFYYNTQIGHKHAGLGDLDFLGEMVTHAHRHNIRVLGYYSNMWDTQLARQHPDWMAEEVDGSYTYNRWPTMSLNSPYRAQVHAHLHEMFTLYSLDGIWSDILSDLPSFDPYTAALYHEDTGRSLPRSRDDAHWIDFVRWQQANLYGYIDSCRNVVKAIHPEAAFVVNFFGTPYAAPSQGLSFKHLPLSDMGSTEGYTEWHGLLFPSYAARYIRAGVNNRPSEVLTGRFINTWDFTVRPLAQMRFEAFSVVANGTAVCIDDAPYHDGTLEPLVFDHIANIYQEIEGRESYLVGATPVRYLGLYQSQKTRELDEVLNQAKAPSVSLTPPSNLNPSDADLLATWMGAYKALSEAHIPVEIVDERPECLTTLDQYNVIYLPNILTLSGEEIDHLTRYVVSGGGLVVTGATGLYDAQATRLPNFSIAHLLGVDYIERGIFTFPYFQFSEFFVTTGLPTRPIPHYSAMWRIAVRQGEEVQIAATRRDPLIETSGETYYHNNQPPPGPDTHEPVITFRRLGKGRVAYCAALPDSNYARTGHAPYRELITQMVLWAANVEPLVSAQGLLNTEIVTNRLGNDLIIHLVTGQPQRNVRWGLNRTADVIEEQASIPFARLRIPRTAKTVYRMTQGKETPVPIDIREAEAMIDLALLTDWETLRIPELFAE